MERSVHAVLLVIFAALIALARFHTYDEPIDRDLGDYATTAHAMHSGKHLYSDLPDQKPPAIHVTYYLAEAIFGYNRLALYAMAAAAGIAGLAAVYVAGLRLSGPRAALWAAAFWTIVSGHLSMEANRPNTEVFMNVFLLAGIACLGRNFRLFSVVAPLLEPKARHHFRSRQRPDVCTHFWRGRGREALGSARALACGLWRPRQRHSLAKQTFGEQKVRVGEGADASTRGACAPQNSPPALFGDSGTNCEQTSRRCPRLASGWAVLAGICFALATTYKQVVVVTPAMICLAYWIVPPKGGSRGRAFAEALLIGGIIVGVWCAMLGWFAWHGRLDAFVKWVVVYNRGYAGSLGENVRQSLGFIFPECMSATMPLAWLTGVGIVLSLLRKQWQPALCLLALAVGTQVAVALPGKYFPHYYQLWFPWLILGASAGIAAIEAHLPVRALGTYAGVVVAGLLLRAELPNYLLSADAWSEEKYGSIFIDSNAAARRAAAILKPDETLFQFGDETEIYPATGRGCPCSLSAVNGAYEGVLVEECRLRLLKELNACLPDLMIEADDAQWEFADDARITGFFRDHYTPILQGRTAPYLFMARKGSDLERRIKNALVLSPASMRR